MGQREDHVDIGVGRRSRRRAASQRSRALAWHFGQCRLRQELKEMVCSPQREHSSTCPPRAEVRQRRMAVSTFWCSQVNHFRLPSKNASPAARITSATSTGGRAIYLLWGGSGLEAQIDNESSGLTVAPTRCLER